MARPIAWRPGQQATAAGWQQRQSRPLRSALRSAGCRWTLGNWGGRQAGGESDREMQQRSGRGGVARCSRDREREGEARCRWALVLVDGELGEEG